MEDHRDKDMEKECPVNTEKEFCAEDVPKIVKLFKEADADGGGGLDIEEFCVAMKQLGNNLTQEQLTALHMKIDTNCDGTVDLGELLSYMFNKNKASESMDYKSQPFPKPFKLVPVDSHKPIVGLWFCHHEDDKQPGGVDDTLTLVRPYKEGLYFAMSEDGTFKFWDDKMNKSYTLPLSKKKESLPYSKIKKVRVSDIVYLKELGQMAVSTCERELIFFDCRVAEKMCNIAYSLILEGDSVNAMHYWCDGTKAMFSFGDVKGFLTVFVSQSINDGLFCTPKYEDDIPLELYDCFYVSKLLKIQDKTHQSFKVHIFSDICSKIQYFPSLESYAICGVSSKEMVLAELPKPPEKRFKKTVFMSKRDHNLFTCVEYSPAVEQLVTGGTDGLLRLWIPHNPEASQRILKEHIKPVTHLLYNPKDAIFISLSVDKHLCVWSDSFMCKQSFRVDNLGMPPITTAYFNVFNNDLVLANSDIAKCLGRGTDYFHKMLTSHDCSLSEALYHNIYKQVISCCQNGVVTVWDVLTGKAVMQFKVTPNQTTWRTVMSLDGPQRRLITISQDGKVQMWNFNNGTCLGVHPVTVQKDVTAIVCHNNRVFVSGRDSNIIFDLDTEGNENRFLEHPYLPNVTSMALHEEMLITASSNGNIIVWDANIPEAMYWFNGSANPRTQMVSQKVRGSSGILPEEKYRKKIKGTRGRSQITRHLTDVIVNPLTVCLKTRKVHADTATVLTTADGYIYAWSVNSKGGLLGKFRSVEDDDAVVTSMCIDANEKILLTGDDTGRIYMWDIQGFGFKGQEDQGSYEERGAWRVSLRPPPRLNTWRCHLSGVVSVKCDPACETIITAGLDHKVLAWTNTGRCIGVFGRDIWDPQQSYLLESAGTDKAESIFSLHEEQTKDKKDTSVQEILQRCEENIDDTEFFLYMAKFDRDSQDISIPPHTSKTERPFKPHLPEVPRKRHGMYTKNGRTTKAYQTDVLEDRVLKPCPADCLSDFPGSEQLSKDTYLPHADETGLRRGFKLHPSQTSHTKGQSQQKPPDNQQRSDPTSQHGHLPPITDKVPLTGQQTQLQPHPPQTQLRHATKRPPVDS